MPEISPLQTTSYTSEPLSNIQKLILAVAAVLCFCVWLGVGKIMNIPIEPGYSGRLLAQPVMGIVGVVITLIILTAITTRLLLPIRFEAGLFCVLIGMVYLPATGGDIRQVLLTSTPGVYTMLAVEQAVWCAIILSGYAVTSFVIQGNANRLNAFGENSRSDTLMDRATVVLSQAVCVLVIVVLLGQSPLKGQALAAICIAGLLSAAVMYKSYAVRGSHWYVIGTFLAGAAADIFSYFYPNGQQIGEVRNTLAGAARSLPWHYAALGAAGTIFGYWTGVTWRESTGTISSTKPVQSTAVH